MPSRSEIDPGRLRRALQLEANRAGDGWVISGGSQVWLVDDTTGCLCPDRQVRGAGCKHELRARLAALDGELLETLRALLGGTQVPARPEIASRGATLRDVSGSERPRVPGLPPEAFQPPTRSRRRGALGPEMGAQ